MKTASLNIDIDPLISYFSIHGIKTTLEGNDPLISLSIPRFLEILDKYSIKATFFVTTSAITPEDMPVLQKIKECGHEIANHSFSHDYSFSRMSENEIEADILKNHKMIEKELGFECKGFRSPGYNSSPAIIKALKKMNYAYDSSLFPSFLYNVAKWLIINKKKLSGRYSSSIINSFSDSFASWKPAFIENYITDRAVNSELIELPITTLFYPFGIPLIGTSVNSFPAFLLKTMFFFSRRRDFINIEMHAIDLCDLSDSNKFKPIEKMQFDLKIPLEIKKKRISEMIEYYINNGFTFITLSDAAGLKLGGKL